jgi:hypothetical protein
MKDVAEITLCTDISLHHKPIIGMQLRYTDDHRACLGQFRFDMDLETIQLKRGIGLYIGGQRTRKSFLYVAKVVVYPPSDRSKLSWIEIRLHNTLEWWFSSRHSVIRHNSSIENAR